MMWLESWQTSHKKDSGHSGLSSPCYPSIKFLESVCNQLPMYPHQEEAYPPTETPFYSRNKCIHSWNQEAYKNCTAWVFNWAGLRQARWEEFLPVSGYSEIGCGTAAFSHSRTIQERLLWLFCRQAGPGKSPVVSLLDPLHSILKVLNAHSIRASEPHVKGTAEAFLHKFWQAKIIQEVVTLLVGEDVKIEKLYSAVVLQWCCKTWVVVWGGVRRFFRNYR